MHVRVRSVLSAMVLAAALLLAPAAGQARVHSRSAVRAAFKEHCIVKPLPQALGGGPITICYVT
jgi:hypothetical protein